MEEDKILYKEFLKGNNKAFDRIMDLYAENLVYFIQRYVKRIDIAEEIAQDVFVYILMNKNKYNFKYSLKTYLYIIGKSRALNYIKKEKRIIELNEDVIYDIDNDLEEKLFKEEKIKNVRKAINKLSKDNQILIYLADIDKLHYKDISKILNKTLPQVKTSIYRARQALKEIRYIMNKEKFKKNVYDKYQQELSQKNSKNNFNIIKKVAIFIILVTCSITVYAGISGNINFEKMGFLKLSENYEENAFQVNKTIDNEYFSLTLESMAGDNAYIIAVYKIKLKDKALNEFEPIEYNEMIGYNLGIENIVLIDDKEINNIMEYVNKDSDSEYTYTQIINTMDITNNELKLDIKLKEFYIGKSGTKHNEVRIDKTIETIVKQDRKDVKKIQPIEQKIDDKVKIVIEDIANTEFESFIRVKKVIDNVTWKEYQDSIALKYNNFIITDENEEPIPYYIYSGVTAGTSIYLEGEQNEVSIVNKIFIKDDNKVKVEENYNIIIGIDENIDKIKIIPTKTTLYNDRTNEEKDFYDKAIWYPLEVGDKKYTQTSSMGGVLEINKIEVNDENISFYYDTKGIIGDESLVLLRMKNGKMNYVYPVREEKKGITGRENKIIFERKPLMSAGLNIHTIDFSDIGKIEFTMLFGSRTEIIGEKIEVNIPSKNEETSTFSNLNIIDN